MFRTRTLPSPFFIVGAGRCGSTRLYELLAPHPAIALTNEGKIVDLAYLVSRFAALPAFRPAEFVVHESVRVHGIVPEEHVAVVSRIFDRHVAEAVLEIYRELFPAKQFVRWGDKLPDPHAAHAIGQVFADTRFVILVRDPRDVLCSFRAFAKKPHVVAANPFLTRTLALPDFCAHFKNLYEGASRYLHPHVVVRYERLVADPLPEVERVLAHLGLAPVPASEMGPSGLFASHATSASPTASVGRWQQDLTAAEIRQVESLLGGFLEEHGYARVG